MEKINIAIDGFSSSGKSTLAKSLASRLHYLYVDSGAMYRAVTLFFIRQHVDCNDPLAIENALDNISIYFERNAGLSSCVTFLNGQQVEAEIRDMEVSSLVSQVSSISEVREAMVAQQKAMAKNKGVVMDGRDIGTVVMPEAALKIFMTASLEVRAKRRFHDLLSKNIPTSYEDVVANLKHRDETDSQRTINPLKKAIDALVLDNSELSEKEQLSWALSKVNDILNVS